MIYFTNTEGLPAPLVHAITSRDQNDEDVYNAIRVSTLLKPPLQAALQKLIGPVEDVSDRIYALLGMTIHEILAENMSQVRFYRECDEYTISGEPDYYVKEPGGFTIYDWKISSVWEAIHGVKPERIEQLNMYRWLMSGPKYNYKVTSLKVGYIFRDWSKLAVVREGGDYPKKQVMIREVPIWSDQKVEEFVTERLLAFVKAWRSVNYLNNFGREIPDDVICTPDERWQKDTKYAVYKTAKSARATKLYDEADWTTGVVERGLKQLGPEAWVEKRPGEATRCMYYCNVSNHCPWWAANKPKENADVE